MPADQAILKICLQHDTQKTSTCSSSNGDDNIQSNSKQALQQPCVTETWQSLYLHHAVASLKTAYNLLLACMQSCEQRASRLKVVPICEDAFLEHFLGEGTLYIHHQLEHLVVGLPRKQDSSSEQLIYDTSDTPNI